MNRRQFVRATRGLGLTIPVRAALFRWVRNEGNSACSLHRFFEQRFHRVEFALHCPCCGPDGVIVQRTPNGQHRRINREDIPCC